ncbi:hypothetical protein L914_03048 [Phytophthora nicotianae]|uniref:Uncharacterized protein n=1 Tax=Phytophthora nicotianae TaxID=4792 RepID=W2NZS8_PHYNI|nr:hypothetical protein L914_03048 [Phytophthora nicotianae]
MAPRKTVAETGAALNSDGSPPLPWPDLAGETWRRLRAFSGVSIVGARALVHRVAEIAEGTPATDQNTRREIIHRCRAAVGALYELDIATNREHRRRKKVRGRLKIAPAIQARKLMLAGWLAGCLPADEAANGKSGHQKMTYNAQPKHSTSGYSAEVARRST